MLQILSLDLKKFDCLEISGVCFDEYLHVSFFWKSEIWNSNGAFVLGLWVKVLAPLKNKIPCKSFSFKVCSTFWAPL